MFDTEDLKESAPHGILDSLRRVLSTVVELLHARAELFTTEVEEELHRAAGLLVWALIAVVAGGFAVLLLSLTIVFIPQIVRVAESGIASRRDVGVLREAGFDAFLAWKQVGPTGRVIGVDMTDDMLNRAKENNISE